MIPEVMGFQSQYEPSSASGMADEMRLKSVGYTESTGYSVEHITAFVSPCTSGPTPRSIEPQHSALIDGLEAMALKVTAPSAKIRSNVGVSASLINAPAPSIPTTIT